ncbi:AraC family transcriptional regulator [Carboxylicivirga sp. A043]|uniref:helix-turn-helix domain-containing protein n=1 Tax=Carboxylicivirga litoralis TaxID=2816963 RepID=UPI0021CB2144|nr:helix-turn-helix domain-containing protein [Carboxylicivirga sp. A043]MCU4157969.1 AraC family transcriptional regulator [Carboxylicivirga sp. A043]
MKVNVKANRWFGFLLLLWSTYWFDEIYLIISGNNVTISSYWPVAWVQFLAPPIFFIAVSYFSVPAYDWRKDAYRFIVLPAVYLLLIFTDALISSDLYYFQMLLILMNALIYTSLSFFRIRKHQKNIQKYTSSTQAINLNWLEYIIMAMIVLVVSVGIFNLVFFELPLNVFMNAAVLGVVLFICYNALKQTEIFPKDTAGVQLVMDISAEEQTKESKRPLLADDKVVELKQKLDGIMEDKAPYLESDLNLIKLAQMVDITSHQLSYVINKGYDENFFQFVNRYRVEKAKHMLADNDNNNLSILGIAFEAGFSSKTSFNTTFKKMTELTPSEYKKKCTTL